MKVIIAAALLAWSATAAADSPVVVPADDTRTHAVASRHELALSTLYTRSDDANGAWFQIGIGPKHWRLPFRGVTTGELEKWTARARFGFFVDDGGDATWAPLTIAAMRIATHDVLEALPFINVQTGLEIAVSTPWLSNRELDPSMHGGSAFLADTELVQNGWSLRPASWHVRLDALLCRSIYLETGIGPELFRSTSEPMRGVDVGLRWHWSLGFSFACPARDTALANLTYSMQYNSRALLYGRDRDPDYQDRLMFALQYKLGRFAIGAFTSWDHELVGVRVLADFGGPGR